MNGILLEVMVVESDASECGKIVECTLAVPDSLITIQFHLLPIHARNIAQALIEAAKVAERKIVSIPN